MRDSRLREAQILGILSEGEAVLPVAEVCRKHGISTACYYQWKIKYSGISTNELKRSRICKRRTPRYSACTRNWRGRTP
ncbi:hypothetical protein CLD22_06055 [Rubrivivax gelatinosus]|nr:hypothetical protein [Rubrivivax gelatinosus]